MQTYISILRGINVSGKNKLPMEGLKALYKELGLTDVLTYIQSGNAIFKADAGMEAALEKKIEAAIRDKYAYEVPVLVRTAKEMEAAIAANPIVKESGIDTEKLHVTFLAATPDSKLVENIPNPGAPNEKFIILNREVYLYCPDGYGNSKLNNGFFEKKLKVKATTRNWKTVNKLLELAS